LTRPHSVPPDDGTLPTSLETSSGEFVNFDEASQAQIRLAAKLHREIARRHTVEAERLERFASERED
jgi:hypothetical protein